MEQTISLLESLVPEFIGHVAKRMKILDTISLYEPIGRRLLASEVGLSERTLRTEIEQLREVDLVIVSKSGISLTNKSKQLLDTLRPIFQLEEYLRQKEYDIQQKFGIKQCRIVSGNANKDEMFFKRLGKAISDILNDILPLELNVLAVTGGTTLSKTVEYVNSDLSQDRYFTVVPARGGGNASLTIEANMVSYMLAQKLKGNSVSLFVPDILTAELHQALLNDSAISETISLLKKTNCLIYSIGNAKIMAGRRGVSKQDIERILTKGAVGEALGVFFDEKGRIVHRLARIGLVLEDLHHLPNEILVVVGSQKAKALNAYMTLAPKNTILVLDEALANMVLKEETL
ncbi:hypothetical protein H1220_05820 [Carnobacteriaceae bacterium zg-84]|uniref:sugar-binding transcriptional regulator n=1 Tax=Granulicatella sp. zg-84 TaxID=2678503 RepID=UPI0013BF8A6A|nr:sugar-binding domain-containing protein [Granulicatella sp. zg-84]NEW65447.1 SorC family transcriptional regulator [Granulicatella sp. zg-84]QMI85243.1 hypothetical protein H1220_05820 [Carnobacteriaceae bacterium zg-84]